MKRPFARPPKGTLRHAAALVILVLPGACGGADAPTDPSSPRPSVSPTPQGVGPIAGAYTLEIRPASSCGMGGPVTFPMIATAAGAGGASPYPGVQVLVAGEGETLEFEIQTMASGISGGLGTTERGALANEAIRVWVRGIGGGAATRAADGRGEITSGRLSGNVAFGHAGGTEGSLGSCDSVTHSYSLRAR
jgi:hypothetical protein